MKRFVYAIALVATMFFASSCEETIFEKDGDWDPIELDKTHVNFPPEGGQNTVSALNYTRWWISGGYDVAELVDNQWEYRGYVHSTSSDGEEACTYDILEGGWYHVMVPDKGKSNAIIITVDSHDGAEPRKAVVEMQAGDAFTRISICQD